jgi:hypothetical protein
MVRTGNGRTVGAVDIDGAKFPKDKPDKVLQLDDIRSLPKHPQYEDIPKQLRAAWKQLVDRVS